MLYFLFLSCFVSLSLCLQAQSPVLKSYTEAEGLSTNTVYQLAQCAKGFLWLATENGLCRFDGQSFRTFSFPDLQDNIIVRVQSKGDSISFLNLQGQLITINSFGRELQRVQGKSGKILDWHYTKQGKLYLKLEKGIFQILDAQSLELRREYRFDSSARSSLEPSKEKQTLVFGQASGLVAFGEQDQVLHYKQGLEEGNKQGQYLRNVESRLLGSDSFALLSSILSKTEERMTDVFLYSAGTLRKLDIPAAYRMAYDLEKIDEQNYILATDRGAYLFSCSSEAVCQVREHVLKGIAVSSILKDKEGSIWLASLGAGLFQWPKQPLKRYAFSEAQGEIEAIGELDEKRIVCQSKQGLVFINEDAQIEEAIIEGLPKACKAILSVDSSYYFYGNNELLQLEKRASVWQKYYFLLDEMRIYNVKCLSYSQEHFWIGRHSGVLELQRAKPRKPIKLIFNSRCHALLYDTINKRLWIGSEQGLYYRDLGEQVKKYRDKQGASIDVFVSTLAQRSNGDLLVGTKGYGLLMLKAGELHKLESKEYQSKSINACLLHEACCYLLCEEGFLCYNMDTKQWKQIDYKRKSPRALAKTKNIVWILERDELLGLSLAEQERRQEALSPVYIEEIQVFDKNEKALPFAPLLPQGVKSIEFHLSAVSFYQKQRFRYRLNGGAWQYIEQGHIVLNSLAAADYLLEISSVLADGRSGPLLSVAFRIEKAIWENPIFFFFVSGLFALLGYLFLRRLHKKRLEQLELRKQQAQLKEELLDLQLKALRAQINPHFVFNAMNAIQHLLLTKREDDALLYLSDFAQLIRKAFEGAAEGLVSLYEELEFLKLYLRLENLRFPDKVQTSIQLSPNIEASSLFLPPMLLQPFVENAFVHGLMHKKQGAQLRIAFDFCERDALLICTIQDNGVGRTRAAELASWRNKRKSMGIGLSLRRLELIAEAGKQSHSHLHIQDLFDEEGQAAGTLVTLYIAQNKSKER